MADISLETVAGKLNRVGYDAFIQALRQAKMLGNRNLELAHWLAQAIQSDRNDIARILDFFKIDRAKVAADVARAVDSLRKNETEMPGVSNVIVDMMDRGWHYATLFFGEAQIRTGHLILAAMKSLDLRRALTSVSAEFAKINIDTLAAEHRKILQSSDEENLRPMDGSGLSAPGSVGDTAPGAKGQTALDRFSQIGRAHV